ncbi:hypothetical protein AKJ09_01308 [Labilithrix luteola]|uniref:Uncharacterized protein n=1 Tax=Labilithrix luteola TaxID=1391654 RepID=A0A0K1PNF8_9BACT|nr:hypothetical protein [Labilithrix luteola]AKU94644.1 hypothetical protein AKJ09_01308 [Labilithrix luteola]
MRFRLLSALSSLTTITALLVACGQVIDPLDEPVDPSTDASFPDGGVGAEADAHVEPLPDAQADGSIVPDDGSADGGQDAAEPPCVEGDVMVMSSSDAAALASITCIRGSLTIDTTSPIALPRLREVSGSIFFVSTSPVVTLDALEVIGANLRVVSSSTSTLSLPLLRNVAGTFAVELASVISIDAPQLASVGDLRISTLGTVQKLSLPALKTISGNATFSMASLRELALPSLERIEGWFSVDALNGLTTLDLPRLRDVVGDVYFAYVRERISLTFPALEHAGSFTVGGTDNRLEELSFPVLTHVGPVSIRLTGRLAQLSMPELIECGGLTLDDAALTTLRLPELKKATGKIWVQPWSKGKLALASMQLPKLEEAESIVLGDLPELASIDLPRLKTVTNELLLFRAPRATQLSLPSLTSVGTLRAYELATITKVSAPLLQGSGTTVITIGPAPMLSRVDLSAVTDLEGVQLQEANRLTTFSLPAATGVKWVEIANLSALTSIAFPALESVSSLGLYGLGKLASVEVPQLHSLNALVLDRAPKLVNLGPLATVPTSLKFLHLANLAAESLVFPNLVETDNLYLSSNYALTNISFPSLARVSTGNIEYCPELPSCSVDAINTRLTSGRIDWYALGRCTP